MNAAPITLAALLGTILLTAIPAASHDAEHGIHNDGAGGASLLGSEADLVLHGRLAGLQPAATLLIFGPALPYSDEELARLRAFVDGGGRLLIADDVGAGRGLLARMELNISLAAVPVYTPVFDTDPREVVAQNQGAFSTWPEQVTLTRPRAVIGEGQALLVSHSLSWLDLDDDGRPDIGEPRSAYAFARLRAVGEGEILVIGSPRVLDNAGHPLRDGILEWAGEGGRRIVVDDGHRSAVDPVGMASVLSGQAAWAWWLLPVAVGVVAIRTFQVRPVRVRARRVRRPPDSPTLEELDP